MSNIIDIILQMLKKTLNMIKLIYIYQITF